MALGADVPAVVLRDVAVDRRGLGGEVAGVVLVERVGLGLLHVLVGVDLRCVLHQVLGHSEGE